MKKIFTLSLLIVSFSIVAHGQIITNIAGTPNTPGYSGNGGPATQATLNEDAFISFDDTGNIFIGDSHNNVIRKVSAKTGFITTVAGNSNNGYNGDGIQATDAELNNPFGTYVDDSENIYIADYGNGRIRKVTAKTGLISTIAGIGSNGWNQQNIDDTPATDAQLSYPTDVTLDDSGNIYIADQWNWVIRKISAKTGYITTVAGNWYLPSNGFSGDGGQATAAQLSLPCAVAVDDSGNLYICDQQNNEIRKVTKATGIITAFAGTGYGHGFGNNNGNYTGNNGPATAADLFTPCDVYMDKSGNVFIADGGNNVVREVSAKTGIITTIAGIGPTSAGYNGDGIPATTAELNGPDGVRVDACGNVYIADNGNDLVRKVIVTDSIKASFTPSVCAGASDTLTASGAGTYSWSPSTGLSDTTGSMVIANPTITTTYVISGTGTCSGTATPATIVVAVTAAPSFTVIQQPLQSTCSGEPVTLSVNGGGSNFTWIPSIGLSATTGSSVIATPSDTTIYVVTGTNSGGCSTTGTDTINIIPSPPLTILPQPGPLFCSGLSAELKVQGGGSNFIWTPSSGLSDTTNDDSVLAAPLVTTTYFVSGYDSIGCLSSGSEVVTVIASPNKPTFYQHGDTLTSSATTDNQWYMNGQPLLNDTSQNLVINNLSPDSFYVVVENEANGCSTPSDTVATTGINQVTLISDQLSIYPNPFNDNIFININSAMQNLKDWSLQVIDVLGRTVYSQQSLNFTNDIDLSNLSSGVYFITVINKTGRAVVPLVKQ